MRGTFLVKNFHTLEFLKTSCEAVKKSHVTNLLLRFGAVLLVRDVNSLQTISIGQKSLRYWHKILKSLAGRSSSSSQVVVLCSLWIFLYLHFRFVSSFSFTFFFSSNEMYLRHCQETNRVMDHFVQAHKKRTWRTVGSSPRNHHEELNRQHHHAVARVS